METSILFGLVFLLLIGFALFSFFLWRVIATNHAYNKHLQTQVKRMKELDHAMRSVDQEREITMALYRAGVISETQALEIIDELTIRINSIQEELEEMD